MSKLKSKYSLHVEKWSNCDKCLLSEYRTNVVLYRGKIPCDVLFIGEAPGESEDAIGKPFIGPAGKLLDHIISKSVPDDVRYGITNVLGCIPLKEKHRKCLKGIDIEHTVEKDEERKPTEKEITACESRLKEIISIASPQVIICLGEIAANHIIRGNKKNEYVTTGMRLITIRHPAFILRANEGQRFVLVQKSIIDIANVCKDIIPF